MTSTLPVSSWPIIGHDGDFYDVEMRCRGSAWCGTFCVALRCLVNDLTCEGPVNRCEVKLYDGDIITGKLDGIVTEPGIDAIIIADQLVELDEIERIRA